MVEIRFPVTMSRFVRGGGYRRSETSTTQRIPVVKDSSLEEKLSKVRGIIFDIDGTIADSWKLGFDATQVMLEKNGIHTITEEIYS